MLEHADSIVAQRDTRLQSLRLLLDDEAFCERLAQLCPESDIRAAHGRYVRYKPHTSCLVAYDVTVGDSQVGVYARCHAEDQVVKITNVRQRAEVRGALGPGLLADTHACIAIFVHPNDYEIRSLRRMFDGEHTPHRLARILPAHPHLHETQLTTIRYKPERRYVGKLESPGGPAAVLRLYPERHFADIHEKSWAFHDSGDLRVPRVVGDSARYSALAHAWIDGQPLVERLSGDDDSVPILGHVAHALAQLHQQHPRLRAMYAASDYCRGVAGACEAVRVLDEDLGKRANELLGMVRMQVLNRPWRSRAVHGDFTADQVLVSGDKVTVLDYDRAGYGDPGMDVGAFAAGLIALSLHGHMPMERAVEAAGAFTSAYWRATHAEDLAGARAFTAGALLMMAPEPFRYRKADWPKMVEALLDSAEGVLQREAIDA